ncbi:glutaredoxin protein [Rhizobium phage RHph_Y68]|uniref:Glutaredoxin protein n=1 Tax=Rhizobium phage RHph_Y68 TaxID=2509787 RepID=A0A7S5R956_9CAUD|nr:glutaredoxin protein [Rhizobium phage RHph_Y68]QIG68044.1 glutaredoxin protein [Rhizobium phage RHph_Y68]
MLELADITVYGMENCRWCEKAKVTLDAAGKSYNYIEIADSAKSSFMDGFQVVYPQSDRTFPRITKKDTQPARHNDNPVRLIGGFDQLIEELLNERI